MCVVVLRGVLLVIELAAEEAFGIIAEEHVGIFADDFHADLIYFLQVHKDQFVHTEFDSFCVQPSGESAFVEFTFFAGAHVIEIAVAGEMFGQDI